MPLKYLIIAALIGIVASLGAALYYLVTTRDAGSSSMVRALTLRIGLSVALFILLFVAWRFGLIQPHGLRP